MLLRAPFVTHIHLRLPEYARRSRDAVLRYTKNLPPDAQLGFTTFSFYGLSRVTPSLKKELSEQKTRLGVGNIVRNVPVVQLQARKWWMGRPATDFNMPENGGKQSKHPKIYNNVLESIKAQRS
jgi:hypothetical protein